MFQDAMAIAAASVDAKSKMKPAIMGATMRQVKSIVLQQKISKILSRKSFRTRTLVDKKVDLIPENCVHCGQLFLVVL